MCFAIWAGACFLLFGRGPRPRPNSKKENATPPKQQKTRKAQTTTKTRQQKTKHSYPSAVSLLWCMCAVQVFLVYVRGVGVAVGGVGAVGYWCNVRGVVALVYVSGVGVVVGGVGTVVYWCGVVVVVYVSGVEVLVYAGGEGAVGYFQQCMRTV